DSNRAPDRRNKIWVMNADESNQRLVADVHNTSNPLFYEDQMPSWSPDGTKILFDGSRDFNGARDCFHANCAELFVINADGSNEQQLTNDPNRGWQYFWPRWSPDRTRIVATLPLETNDDVRQSIDRGYAIIVMNVDGSKQTNII